MDGVVEAIDRLRGAGFVFAVVTNQPDVAVGAIRREDVEEINSALADRLGIQTFKTCWHTDADHCTCRKPLPGLIHMAAHDLAVDPAEGIMIGDRWRDIAAGAAAGCQTILVGDGYGESFPIQPDFRANSLREAVELILSNFQSQA